MIELDPDWGENDPKEETAFVYSSSREDRAVTMLALAIISAAWFFIGSAAGAMLMWWLG